VNDIHWDIGLNRRTTGVIGWGASMAWRISKTGPKWARISICVAAWLALGAAANTARAADAPLPVPSAPPTILPVADPITDYFLQWYVRKDWAYATQPGWMTPLATVTPRLEEEFRYDQFFQERAGGAQTAVFDGGKGLEIIPWWTTELLINLPAYQERTIQSVHQGTTDWNFLNIKQRLVSSPEDQGNYVVSFMVGATAPTGAPAFATGALPQSPWVFTPTLLAGKGWGDFDIQATTALNIQGSQVSVVGDSWVTNVTFQYHFAEFFWPEVEVNNTYWLNGSERGHLDQVFITPGIIFGRFTLANVGFTNIKGIIGVGYQIAVSPEPVFFSASGDRTPQYNHEWIISSRITF
jgi:Putative MetA-pathway of phenol degradation